MTRWTHHHCRRPGLAEADVQGPQRTTEGGYAGARCNYNCECTTFKSAILNVDPFENTW